MFCIHFLFYFFSLVSITEKVLVLVNKLKLLPRKIRRDSAILKHKSVNTNPKRFYVSLLLKGVTT